MVFNYEQLERQLIYTNADTEKDLRKRNGFNTRLLKLLKSNFDNELSPLYIISKNRALTIINEAYYLLACAWDDPNPAESIYDKFFSRMDSSIEFYERDACACCMWLILECKLNLPDKLVAFKFELEHSIREPSLLGPFKQFRNRLNGQKFEIDISPIPVEISELKESKSYVLALLTKGYDRPAIRNVISRYKDKEDKLKLLQLLQDAFPAYVDVLTGTSDPSYYFSRHTPKNGWVRCDRSIELAFWRYAANADRADEAFFRTLEDEVNGITHDDGSGNMAESIAKARLEERDFYDNLLKRLSEELKPSDLQQQLSMSNAKVDMYARENDMLKRKIEELESRLQDKDSSIADLQGKIVPLQQDSDQTSEVDRCFKFKEIVSEALASLDIKYVDFLLQLIYRRTSEVLSPDKTALIGLVNKHSNQLHALAQGIQIGTYVQTGGTMINELHNYLDDLNKYLQNNNGNN